MKSKVICILAESGGVDVVPFVLREISAGTNRSRGFSRGGSRGLRDSGPELAPYVIPLINYSGPDVRKEARGLLRRWNVDNNLLIEQSIKDLSDADQWELGYAVAFLAEHIDEIDPAMKAEVAAGTEKLVAKTNIGVDYKTYQLLAKFYRDPESSTALFETIKNADKYNERIDHRILKMLRDSESETAIEALVFAWKNDHNRTEIAKFLLEINTPVVVEKLAQELDSSSHVKAQEPLLKILKLSLIHI